MQALPLSLILCSSAVLAADINDAIKAATTINVDGVPSVPATVTEGAYNGTFKGSEEITINGQKYVVKYDSLVAASGRLNFQSFENMQAEGAFMSTGKLVLDSFGQVSYYLAADGRVAFVNNVLNAEGAIHVVGDQGDQKVNIGAAGFLTCYKTNMTCTRVEGSYDVSILTNWLKYEGKGNLNGVSGLVNGNIAWSGSRTDQSQGTYQWVNEKIVFVPVDKKDETVTKSKTTATSTTAARKPTSKPDDNGASMVGNSILAVAAGVAAFFF